MQTLSTKKILTIILFLLLGLHSHAEDTQQTIIHVEKAGTLQSYIGDSISYISNLTITGYLNNDDFFYLKNMIGSDGRLEVLNLENSITDEIPVSAFKECKKLTTIILPSSLTAINDSTFCRCSSLISIEIPNTVETIGKSAFGNCSSLT
ncbi:leucine-rich repeat domain-containing protein [Parabacteroides sp. OttesenSCG-928-K15]|nr:leucine-rich repeat domain-containing protein [Parabacteroides sp. OttesenSCG-928-K15]